jgi:hypothetical protein
VEERTHSRRTTHFASFLHKNDCAFDSVNYFLRVIHSCRTPLLTFFFALIFANQLRASNSPIDYLNPNVFTGKIYSDASLKQVLFTFRRTATNSGSEIHVLREFNRPDGTLAVREQVVYEGGQMKSFVLEELQNGGKGVAKVESAGSESKINFDYTIGSTKKTGSEKFLDEILTADMVGPYIAAHFDEINKGAVVKCRLMSLSRAETVGFKFIKESETTWHGKSVMVVKLEPSSIIIAQVVESLHFVVEKEGMHRVLQYTGRTTPSIQKNGKWEDLDAVTVFDWK